MSDCQEYGPLISAMIDDELSPDDLAAADQHLESCANCRRRADSFRTLNRLAATETPATGDWRNDLERRVQRRRRQQSLSWVATYIAAAVVLIAMLGTILHFRRADSPVTNGPEPTVAQLERPGTPIKQDNLIGPLETLQVVSRQEQRTYEAMRRLMELDLRALKLELNQMELAPEQVEQLGRRIDVLIQRVEQAGTDKNTSGESI